MDFPGGRFAIVSDPDGAAFGIVKTRRRRPSASHDNVTRAATLARRAAVAASSCRRARDGAHYVERCLPPPSPPRS